jgi:FG-GAP-like repeat/PASTA domain/FG-GAP repeat
MLSRCEEAQDGWSRSRGMPGAANRRRSVGLVVACAGLALTLGLVAADASPTPSFERPQSFAAGRGPTSVAIGDLNGDGKRDLATANGSSDTVSVLLNRGGRRFGSRLDYKAGEAPVSLAIGDLNGDRKPDLATANYQAGTVSTLVNGGDGSFKHKVDYATGSASYAVAIGDLNGDRKSDVAVTSDARTASVLINTGGGSFEAKRDFGTGHGPVSIAIGDLNGDRKPDLVTTNIVEGTVSVLVNRGDGTFKDKVDYATGPSPSSVAVGDLNGDGKLDLVTANADPSYMHTVSVLTNAGGRFRAKVNFKTGKHPASVAIADLNGDGKPDLVTANLFSRTLSVLANAGAGSFRRRRDYRVEGKPVSVAIADLNGDHKPDLAAANTNNVSVLLNARGRCVVPVVRGTPSSFARSEITLANCRVGKIRRAYSNTVTRGYVISEKPKPWTVLRRGGIVNLVVSRGRKQ